MFFGSWSYDRFNVVKEVQQLCRDKKMTLFAKLYMPFQSYIRRIISGEHFPFELLRFRSMSKSEYYDLMNNSDLIFDVPNRKQVGSSMRTIETLSLKKKLITTNKNVKLEFFYHPDNVLVWPEEKDDLECFVNKSYNAASLSYILNLKQWLNAMGF